MALGETDRLMKEIDKNTISVTMEHLHNFIKEIQNLPITLEMYYGLEPGKQTKHIHHSELKEGQVYDHECTKKSIPEYYTTDEYKNHLYDLANAALTEALLYSKPQQLNVVGRLRMTKNRIEDIEKGISAYTEDNSKDNFEEHEIHRLLTYSFPIINIPYGKPDKWFRARLREIIRLKIKAIDFVKNSLGATLEMVDSSEFMDIINLQKSKTPILLSNALLRAY